MTRASPNSSRSHAKAESQIDFTGDCAPPLAVELPQGWPPQLPLPDKSRAMVDVSDTDMYRLGFSVPEGTDLEAYFLAELPRHGWTIERGPGVIEIEGHNLFGQIELRGRSFWVQLVF